MNRTPGKERRMTATTERSPRSPRWDLMGRYQVYVGGELFLDRLRLIQTPLFAVLVTRIHRADDGRDPHNHSRAFATFILSGGYAEQVWSRPGLRGYGRGRVHRRFSLMVLPQSWAHLVTRVDGPLRTLVFAGRHHREPWSFWTAGGPVDWREYGQDGSLSTFLALAGALEVPAAVLLADPPCKLCDGTPPAGFICSECGRGAM